MFNHRFTRIRALVGAGSGLVLALALSAPAVLADGPQQVTLMATEFAFAPNTVQLVVGQPVQLTIVNKGLIDHDVKSDMPLGNLSYQQAANDADEQADNAANGTFDIDYSKGMTAQITFTPTTAGTYTFHCDIPGHTEAGMTGTFTVVGGGS